MPLTPDRTPGPADEEEIQFEDRTVDGPPTLEGALRRVGEQLLYKKNAVDVVDILAGGDDKKVKVSADDTTPNFLEDKLITGGDLIRNILNPGANEVIELVANIGTIFSADSINSATFFSTTSTDWLDAFAGEPRNYLIPATQGDYVVVFLTDARTSNNNTEMEVALAKNAVPAGVDTGSVHAFSNVQIGLTGSIWRFDGLLITDQIYAAYRKISGNGSVELYSRNLFMFRVA